MVTRINQREIARLFAPDGPIHHDLYEMAQPVENAQKMNAPVDTGKLLGSITRRKGVDARGLYVDVGPEATTKDGYQYALWCELGTAPHVIRPKTKKALWWPGARHPVPEVKHPGTRARPFIVPSLDYLSSRRRFQV